MQQQGYLFIADISGYTAFLTGSELDHAQDIMKSLIENVLDNMPPPVVVSKLEGDAVFAYTPEKSFLLAQSLLELVENIYAGFRRFQRQMHLNTTCTCNACRNIPNLDLKFMLHYGTFLLQSIGGREELSGPDVILIHRLMKNAVVETTGIKAYALLTTTAADAMQLGEITAAMRPHSETYEHLGEVPGYIHDLHVVWEERQQQERVVVEGEAVDFSIEYDLPVPPILAWDYLNEDESRKRYTESSRSMTTERKQGRAAVGTTFHCYHGKDDTQLLVLDWQPFDYLTCKVFVGGMPTRVEMRYTVKLLPTESGTRVIETYTKPVCYGLIGKIIEFVVWPLMAKKMIYHATLRGAEIMQQDITNDLSAGKITAL